MKKPSLPQNKTFAFAWFVFHALVLVPCLFIIARAGTVNLDADLFNMLPKPDIGKAM